MTTKTRYPRDTRQLAFSFTEWRPIPFAPGYEVSAAGVVRRCLPGPRTYVGRLLKPRRHRFGYPWFRLVIDGQKRRFELHTILLTTFRGPKPFPKAEARHLDGDPTNNHLDNLAWGSHRENETDKKRHDTSSAGSRNGAAKLNERDIAKIRQDYAELRSLTKVGARYGIAFQTVSKIVNWQRWRHVDV